MPYVIDSSNMLAVLTPREVKDAFRDTMEKVKKGWYEHEHNNNNETPQVRHE